MRPCAACIYGGRQTRGQVEGCATCCSVAGTRMNSRMSRLGFGCGSAWDGILEEHFARGYSNHNGANLPPRVYIRTCIYVHALFLSSVVCTSSSLSVFFSSSFSLLGLSHPPRLLPLLRSCCTLLPSYLLHSPLLLGHRALGTRSRSDVICIIPVSPPRRSAAQLLAGI